MNQMLNWISDEPLHRACSMYVRYRVFVMEKSIAREDEFDQYEYLCQSTRS